MPSPPANISIAKIQGSGPQSPLLGRMVNAQGVVTAISPGGRMPGFFMQSAEAAPRAKSSSAVFVQTETGTKLLDSIKPGASVQVRGTVAELDQMTSIVVAADGVDILRKSPSKTAPIPEPIELNIPSDPAKRASYLERLEGMRVRLPNAMALGASDKFQSWWGVDEKVVGGLRPADGKPEHQKIEVSAKIGPGTPIVAGDRPERVEGVVADSGRGYSLWQVPAYGQIKRSPYPPQAWGDMDGDGRVTTGDVAILGRRVGTQAASPLDGADLNGDGKVSRADVNAAKARASRDTGAPSYRIASMNMLNLFDLVDGPGTGGKPSANALETQLTRIAGVIKDRMHAPELIAVQEAENVDVLRQLADRPELAGLGYEVALLQGGDRRGINAALLFRGDLVKVDNVRITNTNMPKGLKSKTPSNSHTHVDQLFSRPPLIADVSVKSDDGSVTDSFTIVANHLISKFSPSGAPTDPIRIAQGKFINSLVKDLRTDAPGRDVVVIGDMNDRHNSAAIKALRGPQKNPLLTNAIYDHVPPAERYSYVFQGAPELIDHVLVTPGMAARVARAGVAHLNADVPYSHTWGTAPIGSSDHDHPYVDIAFAGVGEAAAAAQAVSKS